jgi:transposase
VPDATRQTLFPIIKEKVLPDSIVYTDSLTSYYTLNTEGFIHRRINHSETFVEKQNHINGIENFWSQAKRHLRRFNGIPHKNFNLFLQECVWRFNNPKPHLQLDFLINRFLLS